MPKPKKGARLGGSPSNQRKILSNLAAALFEHHAVKTTDAKAKLLRPYAEKLITKAKKGTLADRRNALKLVDNKAVIAHLFNDLAPKFEGREGGYTRIVKVENRKGDNAPMSQISLVLEETVSNEATRATRAADSKKADADKADKAEKTEAEDTPALEVDEATDPQAEAEAIAAAKESEGERAEEAGDAVAAKAVKATEEK